MKASMILKNGIVVTMDKQQTILNPGYLVIQADRIIEISGDRSILDNYDTSKVIDLDGKLVIPGLIDGHCHVRPQRAMGEHRGLAPTEYLERYIHGVSPVMTPENAKVGALLGFGELLRRGVTTVMNMGVFPETEKKAAEEIGIRARLVPLAETNADIEEYFDVLENQEDGEDARVRLWLGMEDAANHDKSILRKCRDIADRLNLGIHTHLSEFERDNLDVLYDNGFLAPGVSLAHCVLVNEHDLDLLEKSGATVVYNANSNCRLAVGIAPIPEMLSRGIPVALGTDGLNSTFRLDILEEMRTAICVHRVATADNTVITQEDALKMATMYGAKAFNKADEIGSLEKGRKADITVFDIEKLWTTPRIYHGEESNILGLLAYCVSSLDTELVIVNGEIAVEGGKLAMIDEKDLITEAQSCGEEIARRLYFT